VFWGLEISEQHFQDAALEAPQLEHLEFLFPNWSPEGHFMDEREKHPDGLTYVTRRPISHERLANELTLSFFFFFS